MGTASRIESFDLLILDIIMPGMNGLELCRMYRQRFGYHSPVVMLTALGTTDDIVKGLDAGADDYLVKPFSFQEARGAYQGFCSAGVRRFLYSNWFVGIDFGLYVAACSPGKHGY